MKVLKYLLLTIGVIIVVVLIAAVFIPKQYKVVRSVAINAPQAVVMDQIKSLKKMNEWSPFTVQDPNIQISYSGNDGEVGSSTYWKSDKVGEGSQTITKLTNDRVETRLDFKKPMESVSTAFLQTANEAGGVKATWGMEGRNPYPLNFMCLFMDNILGAEYEKGLNMLKQKCEQRDNASVIRH
jgi:hypothetical protein